MLPDTVSCGRRCDNCGRQQFRRVHTWPVGHERNPATVPLSVWTCLRCELMMLDPVPTAEQLPAEGDWWGKQEDRRRRRWLKKIWEPIRGRITGGPKAKLVRGTRKAQLGGRLLDVGCGVGDLMLAAAPYYDQCVGIEPSPLAADRCRQQGFRVLEGMFEEVDIEWGSFDVVMMSAVIEHVHSPTAAMERMNRCLKMNGVMCLKTPNLGGPAYRMHGPNWNGFRWGYHTYLFTGRTLGALMEKTGFDVLRRPRRCSVLDDILVLWGRKLREPRAGSAGRAA